MKIIDADKLVKELKQLDLEYMKQSDIIECLKDLINKQPIISKESLLDNIKDEEEISKEIELTKKTIDNYRGEFKSGNIPKDVLRDKIIDCSATIDALRWVLGQNDRFD